MIGIYKIQNLINGKVYIGQSVHIERRFREHKYSDKNNSLIHKAIKKYGIENFSFEVIEECDYLLLDEREIYWISHYNSTNKEKGYNLTQGGQGTRKYNYQEIFSLWQQGLNCQQIQKELNCCDEVITSVLRNYNISERDVRSRAQKNKSIVALRKIDKKPLKIFNNRNDVCKIFKRPPGSGLIDRALKEKSIALGYYWEYLNENNFPKEEISDEDFLKEQECSEINLTVKSRAKNRKCVRPTREELKNLIRNYPFTKIGERYGVSDNAIRKWCDSENLPRKSKEIKSYSDEEWDLI